MTTDNNPTDGSFDEQSAPGLIPLTLELIDRDQSQRLTYYAKELASAGIRRLVDRPGQIKKGA